MDTDSTESELGPAQLACLQEIVRQSSAKPSRGGASVGVLGEVYAFGFDHVRGGGTEVADEQGRGCAKGTEGVWVIVEDWSGDV